jgi:hypothetical protein
MEPVQKSIYSFEFIQSILKENTFPENIHDLTRRRLEQLEKYVDSSNYRNTPMFKNKTFDGGHRGGGHHPSHKPARDFGQIHDGGFQHPKKHFDRGGSTGKFHKSGGFQHGKFGGTRVIVETKDNEWAKNRLATSQKNKDGIERHILAIRSYLNKLTDKTYDEMILNIEEEISQIMKLDNDGIDEYMIRVASHIFDIASMNKFYSQVYARLYQEIIKTHPEFSNILIKKYSEFTKQCLEINYVNPEVNYDGFCSYKSEVERRQGTACFVVHLMNMELLEPSSAIVLFREFISLIEERTNNVESQRVIEDILIILESMFGVANMKLLGTVDELRDTIIPRISKLTGMKPKLHQGLTNKTIFRFMDILDKIK